MQMALDLGAVAEVARVRDRLLAVLGHTPFEPRLVPIDQLILSLISSRTRDEVSLPAFERLLDRFSDWAEAAGAPPETILAVIEPVTFAEDKARRIGEVLRRIAPSHPDFRLDFLGTLPVGQALAWLERLPGVGRKIAASTLNFSLLRRPAFVVDTHVLRILQRFGFIGRRADTVAAHDFVMAAAGGWDWRDLAQFHDLLKKLGQTLCKASVSDCAACPLQPDCAAAKRGQDWAPVTRVPLDARPQ